LNHPDICQIYDVGPDYIVMEYVEGQEIKGPLPLDLALKAAIQLAGALEWKRRIAKRLRIATSSQPTFCRRNPASKFLISASLNLRC
jgi:hypothetical protein